MERQVSATRAGGESFVLQRGPAEAWRELGFPSEEDLLDWLENHADRAAAEPGRPR
jgi:hypothetical protein